MVNIFLNCSRGGKIIARHNAILQTLSEIIKTTGAHIQTEVPVSHINASSIQNRASSVRFDIMVTSRALEHQFTADVTVINPLSSSLAVLTQNASVSGNANRIAENRKNAIYHTVSRDAGYDFFPFSLEL